MKVYAAGVLSVISPQSADNTRLWALFDNFEAAEQTIMTNCGDFFESYYNYALIEEIDILSHIGLYTELSRQWWYKAEFNDDNIAISKIDIPLDFQNVSHWWVG